MLSCTLYIFATVVLFGASSSLAGRNIQEDATSNGPELTALQVADIDAFPLDDVDWVRLQATYAALVNCRVTHNEPLDVIFYGDSITESFRGTMRGRLYEKAADIPAVWKKHFGSWQALPLGVAGDRTVNLLWRIKEGGESPDGLASRSVVLQIGTNDFYNHYEHLWGAVPMTEVATIVAEISAGIAANALALRQQQPRAHILLLAIFPRGEAPPSDDPERYSYSLPSMFTSHITLINQRLEEFAAVHRPITFLDCSHVFLQDAGAGASIDPELMAAALHPTAKGMDRLLDCIKPHLLPPAHHRKPDSEGVA